MERFISCIEITFFEVLDFQNIYINHSILTQNTHKTPIVVISTLREKFFNPIANVFLKYISYKSYPQHPYIKLLEHMVNKELMFSFIIRCLYSTVNTKTKLWPLLCAHLRYLYYVRCINPLYSLYAGHNTREQHIQVYIRKPVRSKKKMNT